MQSFREFYAEKTGIPIAQYPAPPDGSLMAHTVFQQIADVFADYADYVREEMVRQAVAEQIARTRL